MQALSIDSSWIQDDSNLEVAGPLQATLEPFSTIPGLQFLAVHIPWHEEKVIEEVQLSPALQGLSSAFQDDVSLCHCPQFWFSDLETYRNMCLYRNKLFQLMKLQPWVPYAHASLVLAASCCPSLWSLYSPSQINHNGLQSCRNAKHTLSAFSELSSPSLIDAILCPMQIRFCGNWESSGKSV